MSSADPTASPRAGRRRSSLKSAVRSNGLRPASGSATTDVFFRDAAAFTQWMSGHASEELITDEIVAAFDRCAGGRRSPASSYLTEAGSAAACPLGLSATQLTRQGAPARARHGLSSTSTTSSCISDDGGGALTDAAHAGGAASAARLSSRLPEGMEPLAPQRHDPDSCRPSGAA